ncbi:hypothetical protein DIC66_19000 [Rhodoferax lacus]|uniref:STAS/SEC14 domain-containing protein n=1 Tax=Rhodoferax lacus TaxID=2184758 RepID=A0A3E1R7G7_9BURK|nr:hypothetical protein [Rhodoferax lacus]RFO95318.1 hypothetical protein DIC66_19000 [Rhodoferax lacus]
MAYTINWERNGAYICYQDRVTFAEFMGAVLEIHADINYITTKYVIHDMLAASELDFSGLDMTAMVAHELGARFTNPGVRPAVVSSDPNMEASTRAFSDLTRLEVGFFSTVAQARAWVTAAPAQ